MLHVQLIAVSQLDIADGDLLLVFHHGGSHFGLQLSLKLATENICLAARVQLKGTQLLGQLLAIGLKAIHLLGELRLETGVQLLLLTQSLLQALQLGLQGLRKLITGQTKLSQLILMLLAHAADPQALLLDQLGGFETLLLIGLFGVFVGLLLGGIRRVPAFLGSHLQALRLHQLRGVILYQQAHAVAFRRVAQQRQVVMARRQARIPEVHLMPGHRALTATGQANRPSAQVRPAPSVIGQMS